MQYWSVHVWSVTTHSYSSITIWSACIDFRPALHRPQPGVGPPASIESFIKAVFLIRHLMWLTSKIILHQDNEDCFQTMHLKLRRFSLDLLADFFTWLKILSFIQVPLYWWNILLKWIYVNQVELDIFDKKHV